MARDGSYQFEVFPVHPLTSEVRELTRTAGLSEGLSTPKCCTQRGAAERGFDTEYLVLCAHLSIKPTTLNKACPNENGDVESSHGRLKRRLKAHLVLRCSNAFTDEAEWAAFVAGVCNGADALSAAKVPQALPLLRALPTTR